MKNTYSKIHYTGKSHKTGFRYNYEQSTLEWVSKYDGPKWQVVDCMGLSRANWEDSPQYWVEAYQNQINEEAKWELYFDTLPQ